MLNENVAYKVKLKLSFCHKAVILSLSILNIKSKTSFTKGVQFGMLFENVSYKEEVILSLSILNIESNELFYRSCLNWYDI